MRLNTLSNYESTLKYVKEQTPEICLEAVRRDKTLLSMVDKSIFDPE
jgi:hypothetical protein